MEKKRYRFNFIDFIIILIIAVFALMVIYYILLPYSDSPIGVESTDIEYKIRVNGMSNDLKDMVNVDDAVLENSGLNKIGKVKSVEYTDSIYVGIDKTSGRNVSQAYPDRVDMIITVSAKAQTNTGVYIIDGFTISPGTEISFRVPGFSGGAVCEEIHEVGNEQ